MKTFFLGTFRAHKHALDFCLNQLAKGPLASFMLIAVIGLAFSLPACLWVIVDNGKRVTEGVQNNTQMSLFIKASLSDQQVKILVDQVREHSGVQFANYISPEQGLQTLEEQTGISGVSSLLSDSPLPAVIEVHPERLSSEKVKRLYAELKVLDGVDFAKMDWQWFERLSSLLVFLSKTCRGLFVLYALAVLLVVGNSIGLLVYHSAPEIEIFKIVGASDRFVRLPFLYLGCVYGLVGALLAWFIVDMEVAWVQTAAYRLSQVYHSPFKVHGLTLAQGSGVLFMGIFLGYLGARISVWRQLSLFCRSVETV